MIRDTILNGSTKNKVMESVQRLVYRNEVYPRKTGKITFSVEIVWRSTVKLKTEIVRSIGYVINKLKTV